MHDTFLSCDWGTSSFRLRLIDTATLTVVGTSESDEGVAVIFDRWQQSQTDRIGFYQGILQHHIGLLENSTGQELTGLPVVVSGMVSSTIGMMELPYQQLPFSAAGADLLYEVLQSSEQFRHPLILISGARTDNDVMRGEETQLVGCMEHGLDGTQVFIFPGTHSKHITVANGVATHLATYMTGEFFHLLATKSILAKSVAANSALHSAENMAAFNSGVHNSCTQNLLHQSFMVRTNDLFQRYTKEANFWYLSGLLIGTELHSLQHLLHHDVITIVASGTIVSSYQMALEALGRQQVRIINVTDALTRAHALILNQVHA